jgi:hypothetical protein
MSVTVDRYISVSSPLRDIVNLFGGNGSVTNKANIGDGTASVAQATTGSVAGTSVEWIYRAVMAGTPIPAGSTILDYDLQFSAARSSSDAGFTIRPAFWRPVTAANALGGFVFASTAVTTTGQTVYSFNEVDTPPTVGSGFNTDYGSTLLGNTSSIWNSIAIDILLNTPTLTFRTLSVQFVRARITYDPPSAGGGAIFLGSLF